MSVYRVTEIIGTSSTSWEDAAAEAIRTAAGTLRDLRVLRSLCTNPRDQARVQNFFQLLK